MDETSRKSCRDQFGRFIMPQVLELGGLEREIGLDKACLLDSIDNSMHYAGELIERKVWVYTSAFEISKLSGIWSVQKVTRLLQELLQDGYLEEGYFGTRDSWFVNCRWFTKGGGPK